MARIVHNKEGTYTAEQMETEDADRGIQVKRDA